MVILGHSTPSPNFEKINAHEFTPSSQGRLGPGVYFTTQECALQIGLGRLSGGSLAVIRVEVGQGITLQGEYGLPLLGVSLSLCEEPCLVQDPSISLLLRVN